jgi:hypothetical protein
METNACLTCRFGSVKIDISVPYKYDPKKLAEQTKAFTSSLAALTRQKPIHYAVTFEERKISSVDFKVNCSCILNLRKVDCSNYNPSRACRIKHLHPSNLPRLEVAKQIR